MRTPHPSDQSGFSLIEVLGSAFILVIGLLATFTLMDGANATLSANSARTAGTNLARELIEYSRGTDYGRLTDDGIEAALRERPNVKGGTTEPWTIERRGVRYAVASSVCTFDDPKDGLATTPPADPCPAATAVAGAPANDINPEDFRRVTFTLTWKVRSRPGTATQSALIVNPAGGLGPRITAFEPQGEITSGTAVKWAPGVTTPALTSTPAAGVFWTADDGRSHGNATGGPTDWTLEWDLGARDPLVVDGSWVVDGTYHVQAQAKDARGVPGESKVAVVHVNRGRPYPVNRFEGGVNARFGDPIVDLRWERYPERDVLGYKVRRQSDGATVCPSDGAAYITATSCSDVDPPSGGASETYEVMAIDCHSLISCTPRDGHSALLEDIPLTAGTAPPAPGPVVPSVVDGVPVLDWPAPPDGANILFYRIYRDTGTDFEDRYDQTITADPHYSDPDPGTQTTQHTYWVTAVDTSFNESAPSDPVTTQPVTP